MLVGEPKRSLQTELNMPDPAKSQQERPSLRELSAFCGPQTTATIFIGILCGALLFSFEFLMAFVLQLFLIRIGLVPKAATALPEWVLDRVDFKWTLISVVLIGTFRSLMLWIQVYLNSSIFEVQRDFNAVG